MTFGPDEDKGARVTSLDDFKTCLDIFQREGYVLPLVLGGRPAERLLMSLCHH